MPFRKYHVQGESEQVDKTSRSDFRSPDLSCLDFFKWGHVKSLIYEGPVENDMDLVASDIREMPGVFANVHQSLFHRCETCLQVF
ncbi:hypothetical protein X975_01628, partial [Stegodyphus mimosarum]